MSASGSLSPSIPPVECDNETLCDCSLHLQTDSSRHKHASIQSSLVLRPSPFPVSITLHVGVLCCLALLFACFFLPSFSSLIKTCTVYTECPSRPIEVTACTILCSLCSTRQGLASTILPLRNTRHSRDCRHSGGRRK